MKIALVSQEYPPETARGGIGSQTYLKARGLASLGHSVFVISRSIDDCRHEKTEGGITVIRVPGLENQLPEMSEAVAWISNSFVVAAAITDLHKRVGLDMVDFPEWGAEGYIYLLNRTAWNHVPCVIQLHGPLVMFSETMGWPEINSEFYRAGTHMEATCVQLADAVYSSSACSAQWVRTHYHPQKENIPVIHLGVDTDFLAPRAVPKNDYLTIIFAGKLVANKGIVELVEAAGHLAKEFPGLRLRMIGRAEKSVIDNLYKKSTGQFLDLPGFIDRESLPDEMSRAHVFACPSYYEGGPGFVFLEAMACGLPVVGCSGSGVEEIVASGQNGILVPPKDVKALESALRKILSDANLRADMGAKGRQFVIREADSQQCLKRLEDFYNSVLKSQSADLKVF